MLQRTNNGKAPHLDSLTLKQVRVSPSQSLTALKLLAPTQKLYCQGKQLILDLFVQTEFYYEGILSNTGSLTIDGRLRWRETDISINECDAMGPSQPHHWFLRGLTLRLIQTPISWKDLQKLRQAPLILEGGFKQSFLSDLEDPNAPKLIMKEGSLEEALQTASPYPVLQLKDRWGACADLWMNYGQGHLIAFHEPSPTREDIQRKSLFKRQLASEINWKKIC